MKYKTRADSVFLSIIYFIETKDYCTAEI